MHAVATDDGRPCDALPPVLATLDPQGWRWLGAIAAELALGKPILGRLGDPQALDAWLAGGLRTGTLIVSAPGEVSVHPDYEQPVLRHLAATNDLERIARATGTLLEARSVSDIALALQWGDWDAFTRAASVRRLPRAVPFPDAATWLRRSVCAPFDGGWLQETWGDRALFVASRVLEGSLDGPTSCGALVEWLNQVLPELPESERRPLARTLFEHAVLTGDLAMLERIELPDRGHRAAARFCAGDLAGAQVQLDRAFEGALHRPRSSSGTFPTYGAVAPLLAILLCARDDDAAREVAKKLLAAGTREADRDAAKAFRMLLRFLGKPGSEQRRIDVHQFPADASAWELLLAGFTVHLNLQQPWVRASWAQRIARKACEWHDSGHVWLSEQAVSLARSLDEDYCLKELAKRPLTGARLPLWNLLEPKPAWKKSLDALAQVSEAVAQAAERTVRVAWFVDMSDGSLQRPALQEHRAGSGFGTGQRLSIGEVWERRHELPDEDARVLEHTRETRAGRRELLPEAYELLIGHPRVFDGARGMKPVEVVRGSCRVETHEEAGHIRLVVEPAGAELGVNVRPESDHRLVVYRVTPAMRRVIEALPQGARVPKAHEAEVLRVLGRLAESVEVRSDRIGAEREITADPLPCLRLQLVAGAFRVQLGVRPFGENGRFFVAGEGRSSITQQVDGQRLRCTRDLETERARRDALVAACPSLSRPDDDEDVAADDQDAWFFDEASVLGLLSELRDSGVPHAVEWPEANELTVRATVTAKSLHGRVHRLRGRKGWYLATGGIRLDDLTALSLGDLVRAPVVGNGRYLRLPNGDYLEVEERIRGVMAALRAQTSSRPEVEIHPAAFETIRRAVDGGLEVESDAKEWLARADTIESETFPLPDSLQATLRPYQVDGFQWLCRLSELGLGACLADDMGLGKTLQLIALLLRRRDLGPALVVAPTSVCGNWVRELSKFAPSLEVVEWIGKDRTRATLSAGTVLICSYAMLQQDEAELAARTFATAALDEAQFIKNPDSLRARAAFRLQAGQRIALTGTPVENHYGDLWSIFHFILPGLLGDFATFKRRFIQPIESGSSANADPGEAPETMLRKLVQPYVLRRRKQDVLSELPPLTEVQLEVQLPERDELRYALLRKQIHDKLFTAHGRRHSKLQILAELTRLRRFCCHPRLVFPEAEAESAKIEAFLDLAEELRENQHRALVFSQYVDFLGLVREQLDERGIAYEYLDGSTPAAARQARVDAFQEGSASFFLISLKAGGFGLNLTAADYVIHLDPWWNPAVEAQATDRAHRIGQDRRVTVYRLVTKNTIEQQIVELHRKKQRLARSLLDETEGSGNVTADELLRWLAARDHA